MVIQTIKFSEMTDGGDINQGDKTPGLLSGANVLFNNPWTFLAPGTTAERPVPAADNYYRLRLNTTLETYEYYDPVTMLWIPLSGSGTGTVNPGTTNDLAFYPFNGTTVAPINSAANSVLVTDSGSVPSLSTTLPTGLSIPGATITSSTAALLSGSIVAAPVSGTDITNKTYVDSLFGSGVTSITGTTNQVIASSPTGAVTLSLPQDIALSSTPIFAGFNDTNNLAIMRLTTIASAVNYVDIKNAGTGVAPIIAAEGSDTNINLSLSGQGTGYPILIGQNTAIGYEVKSGTSSQHVTNFDFANTAVTRTVTFPDADGTVAFTGSSAGLITGTANQVLVNGTSGVATSGNITLTTPQNINTTAAVQFNSIQLNNGNVFGALGGRIFSLQDQVSAVNYLDIQNAISGATSVNGPIISASGTDMNISFIFRTKGNAPIYFEAGATGANPSFIWWSGTGRQHVTNHILADTNQIRNVTWPDADMTVTGTAAAMTNGQLPIGNTGNLPTAATLTAGTGVSITNGAGSITINAIGGGLTTTNAGSTTVSAAVNTRYISDQAGASTFTLPTTFAIGDTVIIKGLGAAGWILKAGTSTTIRMGSSVTSSGGTITSANQYDTVCVSGLVANTTWSVDYAFSAGLTVA